MTPVQLGSAGAPWRSRQYLAQRETSFHANPDARSRDRSTTTPQEWRPNQAGVQMDEARRLGRAGLWQGRFRLGGPDMARQMAPTGIVLHDAGVVEAPQMCYTQARR